MLGLRIYYLTAKARVGEGYIREKAMVYILA